MLPSFGGLSEDSPRIFDDEDLKIVKKSDGHMEGHIVGIFINVNGFY
jgi:hypothetical protein